MGIDKILKKEGIEVLESLDTLKVNTLAKNIASILAENFPNLQLNANELFMKIARLNMYFAKLPNRNLCKIFF